MQNRQKQWHEQWSILSDDELFLFKDWIKPNILEDFRCKSVLECGAGGGQHTSFIAPYAERVTAVDLNTVDIAQERNKQFSNIEFIEADIATMQLGRLFDIVFSIGVVHHTDDPDATVANLVEHLKHGGRLILWVYSEEGNWLVKRLVEPLRKLFLTGMSRKKLLLLSQLITLIMYVPIYTLYLLPLRFLPFYEYFENFRKMSFVRNTLNVFDKLNAPQVDFISKERGLAWLKESEFEDINMTSYKGVSWCISGTKK